MCCQVRLFVHITMITAALAVCCSAADGTELVPPGRLAVWGVAPFELLGSDTEVQSWEFISPSGAMIPDPDGDASPWETYLVNDPTYVWAYSDPSNAVLVDGALTIDVGTMAFWEFDFWYTTADGTRVPGPILPLSGPTQSTYELVADARDGTLKIVCVGHSYDNDSTYSYSIHSPSGALTPDADGDASPYLTYLSNSETLVSAATSNAVRISESLVLDAQFAGGARDLVFRYEVLGDEDVEPIWVELIQGNVTYIPEPGTFALLAVGVGGVMLLMRRATRTMVA